MGDRERERTSCGRGCTAENLLPLTLNSLWKDNCHTVKPWYHAQAGTVCTFEAKLNVQRLSNAPPVAQSTT